MAAELQQIVRDALDRYLSGTDPREESFRKLALIHRALPILPDWNGFIGLREDGLLLWIAEDMASSEPDAWASHLALVRAGELFPTLAFLAPEPQADWVQCASCEGTGAVTINGVVAPEGVRCQCAGLGRLPPEVASLLERRALAAV